MRIATFTLLAVALLTPACQPFSASTAQAARVADHAKEGHKALLRQDWATAARHLRLAIEKDPNNLSVHYGLAVSASWLQLRDEATREFQWVATNALPTSHEARVAGEWLAGARGGRSVADAEGGPVAAGDSSTTDERVGNSDVHGQVVFDEGQGPAPLPRFQIHLYAINEAGTSKGMSFHIRTDRKGQYKLVRIPAGTYKLTDTNVGTPKWRLRVSVRDGEDLQVDLTPQNSVNVRDDFPKSG